MNELEEAAIAWWKNKRPLVFTLEDHIQNPTINTMTDAEKDLALAVADIVANRYLKKGVKLSEL